MLLSPTKIRGWLPTIYMQFFVWSLSSRKIISDLLGIIWCRYKQEEIGVIEPRNPQKLPHWETLHCPKRSKADLGKSPYESGTKAGYAWQLGLLRVWSHLVLRHLRKATVNVRDTCSGPCGPCGLCQFRINSEFISPQARSRAILETQHRHWFFSAFASLDSYDLLDIDS